MWRAEVELPAVTVSTSVAAVAPLIVTLGCARAQVGDEAVALATVQAMVTVPVKPDAGVTLTVVLAELPLGTVRVAGAALKAKEAPPPPPVKAAVLEL